MKHSAQITGVVRWNGEPYIHIFQWMSQSGFHIFGEEIASQGQETFWASSAVRKTHNYDTKSSNHHPFLSTRRPKGLSRSKMKRWAIYTTLPVDVILAVPHPRSRDSQGKETFLAPSPDKWICNYDTQCSIHHPTLSPLRPKGLSRSKMKWWAIYTNLKVDIILRLPNPWSRDSQDQQAFWALSPDKLTRNYDTEFSNHLTPYQTQGQRDRVVARWNCEPYIQIYQWLS